MTFYTRKGDDGTTGLYYGGRVPKDSAAPEAYGTVDEAQAFVGLVRAEAEKGAELDAMLLQVERDLYVVMAELATLPQNREKLAPGVTMATPDMVIRLEQQIAVITDRFTMPSEFVLPGENRVAALLDAAREAFVQGLQLTAFISAAVMLGTAILTAVLLGRTPTGSEPEPARLPDAESADARDPVPDYARAA